MARAGAVRGSRDGTLASSRGTWQSAAMPTQPPPRSPMAGGAIIAIGTIAGAGIGLFTVVGPTRGLLIGLGASVLVSVAIWLLDRR